ncbi:MAG: hypothetical protein P9M08_05275 [Candidatus Erginobacter occultus]|nr:hypothetical protein [Candidatus Erginobacter occultus]
MSVILIAAVFFPFSGFVSAAESPITQGEWAVYLARGLGLEKALPEETPADRIISILGQGGYQRIEGEDYREAADSLRKTDAPDSVVASQRQWLEAGGESGVARYRFEIPVGRTAVLRARASGGPQFWSVNEGGSVMITPGKELDWREVGSFNLEAGEHEVTVAISPGGALDLFELVGDGFPPIEPPGGFNLLAPLTYGDKAATIVRALDLENELPIDGGFYLIREAELYDQGSGGFRISKNPDPGPASRDEWVEPTGTIRVSYIFELPESGLYSFFSRGFGPTEKEWSIDLGTAKALRRPTDPRKFGWQPVITVYLEAGPHTLEARLKEDGGFDVFQVLRRRAGAGDYLQLLSDFGLQEGALPASPVADHREKRRYELFREVEGEAFSEASGSAKKSDNPDYGAPSNREWIRPGRDPVTLRYRLKLSEQGTYAIYMRSFGTSPVAWTIDPAGESYREKREVFPRSHEAFLWQEVVTLDLESGEHIFEVTLPAGGGLDVFELRKQPWSASDLEALAREPVSREEALRNLEEVEERIDEPEEEEPDEPDEPEEPDEPDEPDYPDLSPYVPGG